MKKTRIRVRYGEFEELFEIARAIPRGWSYRRLSGDRDERGLTFDEIEELPGRWQGTYRTKKEVIRVITDDGKYPIVE